MISKIKGFDCYDVELAEQNDDFESKCYPVYQKYIPTNFWYQARNKIISNLLSQEQKKLLNKKINFLEIGCGNGFVLKHLKTKFPSFSFAGSDIYVEALSYAKQNNTADVLFFQYNLFKKNLNQHFDIIGCFDVLEHIQEDETAMANLRDLIVSDGLAIITVPSDMALWSNNDVINKHKRRYTKAELTTKLEKGGFEILYMNHFVFLLYSLLRIKAKLQKRVTNEDLDEPSIDVAQQLNLKINAVLNAGFSLIMRIEILIMQLGCKFPFGSSLICLVKKK